MRTKRTNQTKDDDADSPGINQRSTEAMAKFLAILSFISAREDEANHRSLVLSMTDFPLFSQITSHEFQQQLICDTRGTSTSGSPLVDDEDDNDDDANDR